MVKYCGNMTNLRDHLTIHHPAETQLKQTNLEQVLAPKLPANSQRAPMLLQFLYAKTFAVSWKTSIHPSIHPLVTHGKSAQTIFFLQGSFKMLILLQNSQEPESPQTWNLKPKWKRTFV